MPRPFDVSTDSPYSVEQIHRAFGDESYWQARIAHFGGGTTTLDHLTVDSAGSVSVATSQGLRSDALPGPLAKVFRGGLSVVRTERWHADGDGAVSGEITISASGVPGSGVGSAVLSPLPHGSRLSLAGTLEVRIPLVGGRIEKYIGDQIVVEIPELQRFTSDWVAQHG
ncbi:DUF2505 domain-containing protein [Mycobacterium sp. SMC-4]|uniref:DUF2505 domain-containing protein n=1 Tax=Mycobacterium sp. SMC-4 TaxID=2857059 RepID=UPI003D069B00